MGIFWPKKNECDEALEYAERLIVIQEQNIDKIVDDIHDLEEDYLRYTDEYEKAVTLSMIQSHVDFKNKMFTNLADLKHSKLRIALLKTTMLDSKAIENETEILTKIQQKIAKTEHNIAFNQTVHADLNGLNSSEISMPDMETTLDIRSRILSKPRENGPKNTYTLVFS